PGLSDRLLFRVLVTARGFEPAFAERVDPATEPIAVTLAPREFAHARPGAVLRGVVVDQFGLPAPGALVRPVGGTRADGKPLGRIAGEPSAIADDRGLFVLVMEEPDAAWLLHVEARNLAPRVFRDVRGGTSDTLRMTRGA